MLATGNPLTMATDHEKVASLAQKLEFSNALVRQLRRELATERTEHGKSKALLAEKEYEIERLLAKDATLRKVAHLEAVLTKRNKEITSLERLRNTLLSKLNSTR